MKLAIVFSGGGSRGAYQVGAWKALEELGIKASIVVGTSIGSVTAALYCVDKLDDAIKKYEKMSIRNIFDSDKLGLKKKPINLRKTLEKYIKFEDLKNSNIKYGLVTTSFPKLKKIEITKRSMNENNYIDYIIASCTIPLLFEKIKIDNKKFIDGGVKDAVPVSLAEKLGADKIIIINTSLVGRNYKFDNDNYIMIKPSKKISSPIKFDSEESKRMMELGYNDTMKKLKKITDEFIEIN